MGPESSQTTPNHAARTHEKEEPLVFVILGCVWFHGYSWMGRGYPWMRIVWLGGQISSGYSKYGMFSQDRRYRGHKKSGGQAHPPLHGMGLAHVAATINGCMQP